MPKVKVPRKSVSIDMTPMVDMAFLLVTFFMLTTQFHATEPVSIAKPASISKTKLPDLNVMTIVVSNDGRVFFDLTGKYFRESLIQNMAQQYGIPLSADEKEAYGVAGEIGIPMSQMKGYLDATPAERKKMQQTGIPVDSAHNELRDWLTYAREANQMSAITIKADKDANYAVIKNVFSTLVDQNATTFSLITDLKTVPIAKKT